MKEFKREYPFLFTVAIPAFKAKYLKECIDSILNQSYVNFELIIVNDASPENLDEIVYNYNDERIQYYKNEKNFGAEHVVDNWNKCLSYAKGDYFVLMGDDDCLESNYLEEFSLLIQKFFNLDVFHCQSYIIDENSNKIDITTACPEYESTLENIWHRTHFLRQQYISDFVYRSSKLKENGGFYKLPLAWGSDDLSAYIAMGDKGIAHINKPIFNYRRNSLTISSTGNVELKMEAVISVHNWLMNLLNNKFIKEKDLVLKKVLLKDILKYTQKKKIQIMTLSFHEKIFSRFYYWNISKAKYAISISEIIYAYFEFVKSKRVHKKF